MASQQAIAERGGKFPGATQMGKNYMTYLTGGAYDDDTYSLYAPAEYGMQGQVSLNATIPDSLRMQNPTDPNMVRSAPVTSMPNKIQAPLATETQPEQMSRQMQQQMCQQMPQQMPQPQVPRQQPPQQSNNYFSCARCGSLATQTCGCPYRDSTCSNGHSWYIAGGTIQPGFPPNHS